MVLQEFPEGGAGDLGAPPAPAEVEGVVGPWQLDESVWHAGLPQPIGKQLGLSRRHYLVVAPVGEEGRRIPGIDAGNGREEVVALGHHVRGAAEEPVHSTQVASGGDAGEVGGRVNATTAATLSGRWSWLVLAGTGRKRRKTGWRW